MRLEFIKNLKGSEVLARTIYSSNGTALITAGHKINELFIQKLMDCGIYLVYIEDERFDDIIEDPILNDLKQTALQSLPTLFSNLINSSNIYLEEDLKQVDGLLRYIVDSKSANINLYEVKVYDEYTYIHCVDTAIMSVFLGMTLGYNKDSLKELGRAAVLHDIGKMKIPNIVLNKKGPLTNEEFSLIKMHPRYSREILENTSMFSHKILDAVEQHHERVDGRGYLRGLKESEISDYAKIITVCDVFTAISANRCYRARFAPNEAYEYILMGSNTMFSKAVVDKFRQTFAIYPLGCCVRLSNGVEGFVVKQNIGFPDRPVLRIVHNPKINSNVQNYELNLLEQVNVVIKEVV
jgi:HD-GYP domain-containing protein (c-di-GMP phosphodiesterase class II)